METRVKKWGNSLALRIPKPLAEEVGLEEDAFVELSLQEGRLVIVPASNPKYDLDELLAEITSENLHTEIDTGPATGIETW